MNTKKSMVGKQLIVAGLVVAVAGLSACSKKESKPGQALASVNGSEVTVLQLNEELQRSGVAPAQQEGASKQILQSLIDRQLLQDAAAEEKIDRDPKVVQAVERAKALIMAQAYMQKHIGTPAAPTKAEVEAYYQAHPEFFSSRKQFDMRQLLLSTKDMTAEAKSAIDGAKSLEEVASWFEAHQVKFSRGQVTRTGADLPPELSSKLISLPKGQLFIVREGERSVLSQIVEIKDSPVTLEVAAPQIQQFLFNKRNKEAADAEVSRLRSKAKIVYLNESMAPGKDAPAAPAAASASAAASEAVPAASGDASAPAAAVDDTQAARGVSGLK